MADLGEGRVRVNKATNFLIAQARNAQRMWGLSDEAVLRAVIEAKEALKSDISGKAVEAGFARCERPSSVWLKGDNNG